MSIAQVGCNTTGTDYKQYQKTDEIFFKTYSYKNGAGQENVYYKKDCVELSLQSHMISEVDNYDEIRSMLKAQSAGNIISPGNRYLGETHNIMRDYYDGKISCEEVKTIFKEYVYHTFGRPDETKEDSMSVYEKQRFTGWLSGLYEYFSRANTRNACANNMHEGKALLEENGINWKRTYYYNSDWYYLCQEMQKMFQETANELSEEYGTEQIDFTYVEQHTRFTLDGGITFNGVWDSMEWQINREQVVGGSLHDMSMIPPKGFLYCSNTVWDGKSELEGFKEHFNSEKTESSFKLFLLAAVKNVRMNKSLLLNRDNYFESSEWEENDTYQNAMSFLENFNISWQFGSNRLEFLMIR